VHDDVGAGKQLGATHRDEPGITRAGPHEVHGHGALVGVVVGREASAAISSRPAPAGAVEQRGTLPRVRWRAGLAARVRANDNPPVRRAMRSTP